MNVRRAIFILAWLVIGMILSAPRAKADSIEYIFSGNNVGLKGADGLPVSLDFISSGYINTLTPVLGSQLTSCVNCFQSTSVPAAEFRPQDPNGPAIGFVDVNKIEFFYRFAPGSFSAPGTYTSLAGSYPGALTVKDLKDVPEPSTIELLGAALSAIFLWKLFASR
jgi:hypothetical protein